MTNEEKKYCKERCMRGGDLSKCPYYTRNKTCEKAQLFADAFSDGYDLAIEKACEWLFKNTRFTTNDIRDFKKAMEEL